MHSIYISERYLYSLVYTSKKVVKKYVVCICTKRDLEVYREFGL